MQTSLSPTLSRSLLASPQHIVVARAAILAAYFALSWLHVAWESQPYFHGAAPTLAATFSFAFHVAAWLGYSSIYIALALLPALLATRFCSSNHYYQSLAVIGSIIGLLVLRTDRSVFDLYNFHLNGFVLNLVMTPGGIDSLGGGSDSYRGMALVVARIVFIQLILLWLARFIASLFGLITRRTIAIICALLIAFVQLSYGVADLRNDGAVLDTADNYPLFMRVRFRSLATSLGFPPVSRTRASAVTKIDSSRLQYPLQPMLYENATRPLNIVWLVAESLRWDQLTADIMPNTWALAQRGQHFLNHYSSGNGTREGLFGMFYGLYGSYWDNFLHAGRGPLLIERMQALNYQMELRTSARFTYPEFDKTLFIDVPHQFMHEEEFKGEGWQRDRDNTSALINYIGDRQLEHARKDNTSPFFAFMFFESTHARYGFPDEAVIRKPYLEAIDYSDMSREKLAPYADQLRNRYSNSAHWVDAQIGRVIDDLRRRQLLDNTMIIITGDHGEEFMEKGFWGHNSSFVEEQTHTPLVVWMPGMAPHKNERTTSHMDIAVTLMQLLGASNDIGDYALGRNLFEDKKNIDDKHKSRDFIVISDWHSIGIKAIDFKYRIPYTNRVTDNFRPTRGDDSPLKDGESERAAIARHQQVILEAVRNISKFAK